MQNILQRCQGCSWFISMDLAPGLFQLPIAESDRHETACRDAFVQMWEYVRCGYGLKILPPVFASMVAGFLSELGGNGAENNLDDILIYTRDFDEHLTLIAVLITRLQSAGPSMSFPKSRWCCTSQEFVDMIVDRQSVRPAESNTAESAALPPPSTAEDLSPFVGMTGYLRKLGERCMLAVPLTNIHRNKAFASKRARQARIPWSEQHQHVFLSLMSALVSVPVLAFPM